MNEDEEDFIFDQLGICSCGNTGRQVEVLVKYLNALNSSNFEDKKPGALRVLMDNPEIIYEILNHFLVEKDVVEYGSSVTHAWYCDPRNNKDFLKRANSVLDAYEDNNDKTA